LTFYIDLFYITNYVDFIKEIYKKIAFSLYDDYKIIIKKLKELFARVNFTVVVKNNGELEFNPILNSYNLDELVSDIYRGLDKLSAQSNKKIVIAFDEFHKIDLLKEHNIEFILKKYIDKYPNIQYIFTGLKRRLLTDIFSKRKSPLYGIVDFFELKPIPKDEFYTFVNEKFAGSFPLELFETLYEITEGESKLIQEVCYHLFYKINLDGIKLISQDDIDFVCSLLIDSKSEYFKLLLNQFSAPQAIALKAMIVSRGTELYTKDNLFRLQTTKSSLSAAIRYLYKDEIINKENNKYYIYNKCFELWCNKKLL